MVRSVFYLQEGDTIFIAIGQSGSDACSNYTLDMELCRHSNKTDSIEGKQMDNNGKANGKMIEVGGGGGGATYGMLNIFNGHNNGNIITHKKIVLVNEQLMCTLFII